MFFYVDTSVVPGFYDNVQVSHDLGFQKPLQNLNLKKFS